VSNYEAPLDWVPATLTADQVREVNARNAVECELIDEALGRVLAAIAARAGTTTSTSCSPPTTASSRATSACCSRARTTSTADAAAAGLAPGAVGGSGAGHRHPPVGLVDLAPTFCAIAGVPVPEWMEGRPLPVDDADADARGFERVLTEWDSVLFGVDVHLRTITRDGWVCTTYLPGHSHDGTEGELYDLADDPLQQVNRWDDPAVRVAARRPARRPVGPPARDAQSAPAGRSPRLSRGPSGVRGRLSEFSQSRSYGRGRSDPSIERPPT
jgi:hypothetical protein